MPKSQKRTGLPEGFSLVGPDDIYRLIWRSWGAEKSGKNHFGFTGPSPIVGQYFDPGGIEGVAEKFVRGEVPGIPAKEISAKFYKFNKTEDGQDDAREVRDSFVADYREILKYARTIQWDETEFWAACRFAEFGKESSIGRDYGPLNGFYRGLLQEAYDAGVNLQLIQKVKERWVNDKPSGQFDPMGFKEANYVVQANLEHWWTQDEGFCFRVVNCRQNMEVAGETFSDSSLPALGQLIFPNSNEDDWS